MQKIGVYGWCSCGEVQILEKHPSQERMGKHWNCDAFSLCFHHFTPFQRSLNLWGKALWSFVAQKKNIWIKNLFFPFAVVRFLTEQVPTHFFFSFPLDIAIDRPPDKDGHKICQSLFPAKKWDVNCIRMEERVSIFQALGEIGEKRVLCSVKLHAWPLLVLRIDPRRTIEKT